MQKALLAAYALAFAAAPVLAEVGESAGGYCDGRGGGWMGMAGSGFGLGQMILIKIGFFIGALAFIALATLIVKMIWKSK
ncbi:MAG: hypothetical protein V2A63_03705 [Patescibacteria group bacterium]